MKPESILKLEVLLSIEINVIEGNKDLLSWESRNTFLLDNNNEVIGLNLKANDIEDIFFLKDFNNIIYLNLSENKLKDISILKDCKSIKELVLRNNLFVISNLEHLKELNYLDISSNYNVNNQYDILKNLINLKTLYLDGLQIDNYKFLEKITELEELSICQSNLSDVNFLANRKLKKLSIDYNRITDLSGLSGLNELIEIEASHNLITDISPLKELKKIKTLDLSSNPIKKCLSLIKLTEITDLKLHSCSITEISFIANMTKLKYLQLSGNNIQDIKFLKNLKQLEFLYLWSNNINDISHLKNLTKLEYLDVYKNQITDLNPLSDLLGIKRLDIASNKISDLRPIKNLLKINEVILDENNYDGDFIVAYDNFFTIPPIEVVEQGKDVILQYFTDAEIYGLKKLNECKIILVGDGELGKTSLMKKLVGQPFNDKEKTTHGINKISWRDIRNENDEEIKVNLWDFGGQHIQHNLHQFFLTEKVIYILLLNPRNDTTAMYWLEQIDKLGKDSEVLIVYNWKNEKDRDSHNTKNFYELRKKYPQLKEPYLLSCLNGDGFDVFKNQLIDVIISQQELNIQYPLNWYSIKEELEKDVTITKNFIAYNEYDNICLKYNYTNEKNSRNLLRQLDKIGSIVFFDKPILNDLQVLNPDWITTGAYSIITSKLTSEKKGHLTTNDLKIIFKEEKELFADKIIRLKYRQRDFLFIIALMTEYDLCVKNPFNEEEYLIPCAFEGEKPKQFDDYKVNATHYRFQFDSAFEMLIMYRFMARNISKCITESAYWQSGIVVKDSASNTFALVETNQYSKIIDFWISGDNIRGLWETFRRDIKDINSKYSLDYQEQVLFRSSSDNKDVFLSYDEMIDSLMNGISIIHYHPGLRIHNIDVLKIIDNFEDSQNTLKAMKEKNININVGGDFISKGNMQVGGEKNTQSSYINNYQNNPQIKDLKEILEDFEDVCKENKEWQENFTNALKELYRLEDAKDEIDERKSISKLQKFFLKAKEVKDWVSIGVLPAEIATKGHKMLELGQNLFDYLSKII